MPCTYKCKIEACTSNHCSRGKAISIIYSKHVSVVLSYPAAMRMRRILLSSAAYLALPYFPMRCYKQHEFRGGKSH